MARTLNGVEIYDPADLYRDSINTEVLSTIHRIPDLALLMDGTTSNMDAVHKIAATMAGGVGGAWTEESNWQNLLCAKAPVIAEATDNLYSDEDASFEGNTSGTWAAGGGAAIAAIATDGWHGSHCLQITAAGANASATNDVTAVTANAQYTYSAYVKAGNAGAVGESVVMQLIGDVSGTTAGTAVTLTTSWQLAKVTKTFAGDSARTAVAALCAGSDAADIILVDANMIEAKAYATPFALNSRTACTMTFPTASLSLVAGQDISIVVVTKTPWDGTSAAGHMLWAGSATAAAENRLRILTSAGTAYFLVSDAANVLYYKSLPVDAVNWAADTTHVVIGTRNGAGTLAAYLDGVVFSGTVGTARKESALNANQYIGVNVDGTGYPANAPLLVAIYNRVLSAREISLLSRMGAWCQRMKGY